MADEPRVPPKDFIRAKIDADRASGKYDRPVMTRFPPEPNGYLHIGHAKAICLNGEIAREYEGAVFNLRFDDTNPAKEEIEYAEAIQKDVRWLGYDWGGEPYYTSDYFGQLYDFAVKLIEKGMAYVCDLSEAEIREYRGTVHEAGRESPYRDRSTDENLDLFARMKAGEFPDGSRVLRAKIDMEAANMVMRDPILYRIRRAHHYRTGDDWFVYPMYDFAHCLSDAIEGITHSLCSIEFKDNRELYDWILREVEFPRPPEQTEFARLELDYVVVSKRKLIRLVKEGHVSGWDDPRMPTLAGLRRRGVTPSALRAFCDMVGVARVSSRVDIGKLEFAIRDDLNLTVPRVMAVLQPLKVVITNFPEGQVDRIEAPLYPHDVPLEGTRELPFTREILIERDDFSLEPPKGFFRMAPGREVRLRYGYLVTCTDVIKDADGEVTEVHCTYDPATRGGNAPDDRKVKGTIHWISATESVPCQVRLYDRLFAVPEPENLPEGGDFVNNLNPESVAVIDEARIEPSVAADAPGTRYQFERTGYFMSDPIESASGKLVYNRIVPLRDTWAKISARSKGEAVRDDSRVVRKGKGARGKGQGARGDEGTSTPQGQSGPTQRELQTNGAGDASPEQQSRAAGYAAEHGLAESDALVLSGSEGVATLFEEAVAEGVEPQVAANWIVNELLRDGRDEVASGLKFGGAEFAALLRLVADESITRSVARTVLSEMVAKGGEPAGIVERDGLAGNVDAAAVAALIDRILTAHPDRVDQYRSGRKGLAGFFMGQIMKETGGRVDPAVAQELLEAALG